MKILAVIPARGGSKGIPKKNIRLMNGNPLISYAINAARKSKYIADVFVSTDNNEIADVSKKNGANIIFRDENLSSDLVTLDPVIYHAMEQAEKISNCKYDVVITLQPTSPLLTVDTLDKAIKYFINKKLDTIISGINKPHLSWGKQDGKLVPLYEERKNRQELPAQYFETGAFVITKSNYVQQNSRIGKNISIYEIPEQESIDIDDKNDWILAESLLKRKKIVFRVDGYIELGMGHIYNCITLAYSMIEHDVLLVTDEKSKEGIEKIKESNLPYCTVKNDADIDQIIQNFKPDIWVNDCLDTEAEYIAYLKNFVARVVTIEDLGTGINKADAVINALYDEIETQNSRVYSGYKYVCLRDEFQAEKPAKFSEDVKNILVMFGGTDPSNLNKILYQSILNFSAKYENIKFIFITGIGYDYESNGVITREDKNIFVYPNVSRVSKYMKTADLAITSQGRTIFELSAMGVPSIVLSQNQREKAHRFAQMEHGFLNLGVGTEVNQQLIENTLEWLINTVAIRKNMYEIMLRYPLRQGLQRVKNIILGDYNE
jgi:CMP-N-acetylneuraminic acid synthetase/spore coat polysaccharide biosynthesis predicted glycosyltransferase SpsG